MRDSDKFIIEDKTIHILDIFVKQKDFVLYMNVNYNRWIAVIWGQAIDVYFQKATAQQYTDVYSSYTVAEWII